MDRVWFQIGFWGFRLVCFVRNPFRLVLGGASAPKDQSEPVQTKTISHQQKQSETKPGVQNRPPVEPTLCLTMRRCLGPGYTRVPHLYESSMYPQPVRCPHPAGSPGRLGPRNRLYGTAAVTTTRSTFKIEDPSLGPGRIVFRAPDEGFKRVLMGLMGLNKVLIMF